jgi:hypothetical protein
MNIDFRHGFRDARSTLGPIWPATAAAASLAALVLAGVLEARATGSAASARAAQLRLLQGVAFGLVLPLLAHAVSGRLGARLPDLMAFAWPRYGGDRRWYALGRLAVPGLLSGAVTALCGVLALGLGSATSAAAHELPPSLLNVLAVIWIAVLGGFAYVACLSLAHRAAGNVGRLSFLVADWVFGGGTSAIALPWPRAHVRALLGGGAPLELQPHDSAVLLAAIGLLASFAYLRRVPR